MPLCKKCNEVVGAMEINSNGVCKNCMPLEEKNNSKEEISQNNILEPQEGVYEIITFALGVLGFFGVSLVSAPLTLFLGFKYAKSTILTQLGLILALIQIVILIIAFLNGVAIFSSFIH